MQKTNWNDRKLTVGLPQGMFPFYVERLTGTGLRVNSKLKDISDKVLSERLDGKWSIKENLAHLTELNEIAIIRIKEIINGVSVMTPAHAELKQDYNAQSIELLLKSFIKSRSEAIVGFNNLDDAVLQRSSLHPRFKVPMTPVDLAWFYAEHDDHHLVRMNEIIAVLKN